MKLCWNHTILLIDSSVYLLQRKWICPEGMQPCNLKKIHLLKKKQDIRNIVHRVTTPQSLSKQAPWDLTQFSQSPSAALSYFPESHLWSEISSLSKAILVLGKTRSNRVKNLGFSGAESPGWFDVLQKKLFTNHDAWVRALLWWSCRSPFAYRCGLLNHPNNFWEGKFI